MGSEMEPLLRAWSYFRRRKFQLCADLCTQMLEKSPYDQVPDGPRQSVDPLAEAVGSRGSLYPLGGGPGGGLKTRLPVWSAKAPGARLFGILDANSCSLHPLGILSSVP